MESLRLGFPSAIYETARSIDSLRGILVNKLSTSNETINLPEISTLLSSWTKEKESEIVNLSIVNYIYL